MFKKYMLFAIGAFFMIHSSYANAAVKDIHAELSKIASQQSVFSDNKQLSRNKNGTQEELAQSIPPYPGCCRTTPAPK